MAKEQGHLNIFDILFIAISAIPSAALIHYGPVMGFWVKVGAITAGIVLFHVLLTLATMWLAQNRKKRR
ncbi:MAG: hypothetical protein JWM57_301 [Phycisphaerales bacterium]|nr:hypothetical protein [Phycisphaerales bacterium]